MTNLPLPERFEPTPEVAPELYSEQGGNRSISVWGGFSGWKFLAPGALVLAAAASLGALSQRAAIAPAAPAVSAAPAAYDGKHCPPLPVRGSPGISVYGMYDIFPIGTGHIPSRAWQVQLQLYRLA